MVIMIKFHEFHGGTAAGALERVITKGRKHAVPPAVKGKEDFLLFF